MQIKDIKTLVARLGAIVDGWDEKVGAPAVERHIAASLLAELYEAVKFDAALAATILAETEKVEEDVAVEPVAVVEQSTEEVEESSPAVIDLSDIFGFSSDDDEVADEEVDLPLTEEAATAVEEPADEVEQEPEEEPLPIEIEEESAIEDEIEEAIEETIDADEQIVAEESPSEEVVEEKSAEEKIEEVEETMQPEEDVEPLAELVEEEKIEEPIEEIAAEQSTETAESPSEVAEPKSVPQTSLFDMDMVRRPRSSNSRRVIMSLYGESPTRREKSEKVEKNEKHSVKEEQSAPENVEQKSAVAPQSDPIQNVPVENTPIQTEPTQNNATANEQPAEEPITVAVSAAERIAAAQVEGQGTQVLGEVIGVGTTTLADAVAASQPQIQTVQNDRVGSLRSSIGINDRFILIRDLFNGDGAAYEKAIEELDSFDDFNECLVHIATEYRWNPNSDGARMIMDLITRKLL
jgi:hypothetical protein